MYNFDTFPYPHSLLDDAENFGFGFDRAFLQARPELGSRALQLVNSDAVKIEYLDEELYLISEEDGTNILSVCVTARWRPDSQPILIAIDEMS